MAPQRTSDWDGREPATPRWRPGSPHAPLRSPGTTVSEAAAPILMQGFAGAENGEAWPSAAQRRRKARRGEPVRAAAEQVEWGERVRGTRPALWLRREPGVVDFRSLMSFRVWLRCL